MASTRFDWDPDKDAENQHKHGVSFSRAQYAFADPLRVIATDVSHSQTEERVAFGPRSLALADLVVEFWRGDL